MKKLKKLWPLFLSLAILIVLVVLVFAKPKVILFYGSTCPHCKNVEEYLVANPTEIKYRHLEVYDNAQNAILMADKAKSCGLNTETVGVPFLFDGKNCLVGDKDIINWFSNK